MRVIGPTPSYTSWLEVMRRRMRQDLQPCLCVLPPPEACVGWCAWGSPPLYSPSCVDPSAFEDCLPQIVSRAPAIRPAATGLTHMSPGSLEAAGGEEGALPGRGDPGLSQPLRERSRAPQLPPYQHLCEEHVSMRFNPPKQGRAVPQPPSAVCIILTIGHDVESGIKFAVVAD